MELLELRSLSILFLYKYEYIKLEDESEHV